MTKLRPLEGIGLQKWWLAHFGPNISYFGQMFWDLDFKFVLPIIYINIDILEPNEKSIGLKLAIWAHKNLQKTLKWPYHNSQDPILPKCLSPKSLFLLHIQQIHLKFSESMLICISQILIMAGF